MHSHDRLRTSVLTVKMTVLGYSKDACYGCQNKLMETAERDKTLTSEASFCRSCSSLCRN